MATTTTTTTTATATDTAAEGDQQQFRDFAAPTFDAVSYASRVIQGSDIATSLAQLSIGIDSLNKQLQQQIVLHNDDLLRQVTGIDELDDVLSLARGGLDTVQLSMTRLHEKIRDPYNEIATRTRQLESLQETTELLRQLVRYLHLSRRLRAHLQTGAQDITKAAQCLNEMDGLLRDRLLVSLSVVQGERSWIDRAHHVVLGQADQMLQDGLSAIQNHGDVGTAVQVFYNMDQLSPKVAQVMQSIHNGVIVEIKKLLDLKTVGSDAKDSMAKSPAGGLGGIRRVGEPTGAQTSAWTLALWQNLEKLMDSLASLSQKVILLEQVLARRRDLSSHASFLDEVLKLLNSNGVVVDFWHFVGETLEKELAHAMKHSSFLQNTLQGDYPKLLRQFHLFFQRVQTIYQAISMSGGFTTGLTGALSQNCGIDAGSLAQQVVRKALTSLETSYLSRSLTRMFDPINLAFPSSAIGNSTMSKVPTKSDVAVIVKIITTELDAVAFDPALLKAVIRNASKAVKLFAVKSENTIDNQPGVYALSSTSTPTEVQARNIETLNALYTLYDMLFKSLLASSPANAALQRSDVVEALEEALQSVQQSMLSVVEPLLQAVADVIESQIALVHCEDFSGAAPAASAVSGTPDAPCSKYMKDVSSTISHLQQTYLSRLDCPSELKHWMTTLTSYLVNMFLRHISIVRPLGDGGKLRMAADMAQFELGLAPLFTATGMSLASIGKPYKALRAFRPLLFLDTAQVVAKHHRRDIDLVLVVHQLMVRSSSELMLPHQRVGWSPSEYVAWLDTHSTSEINTLLQNNLNAYAADIMRRGEKQYTPEYPLVTKLLQRSSEEDEHP